MGDWVVSPTALKFVRVSFEALFHRPRRRRSNGFICVDTIIPVFMLWWSCRCWVFPFYMRRLRMIDRYTDAIVVVILGLVAKLNHAAFFRRQRRKQTNVGWVWMPAAENVEINVKMTSLQKFHSISVDSRDTIPKRLDSGWETIARCNSGPVALPLQTNSFQECIFFQFDSLLMPSDQESVVGDTPFYWVNCPYGHVEEQLSRIRVLGLT